MFQQNPRIDDDMDVKVTWSTYFKFCAGLCVVKYVFNV